MSKNVILPVSSIPPSIWKKRVAMFSFAKNIVKTLEQSAESIITSSSNLIKTESDPYFQSAGTSYGFRVLHVDPHNPTSTSLGFEPWFDYIVGINGHELLSLAGDTTGVPDYNLFIQEIQNCINKPVSFNVWSAKGGILRQISLVSIGQYEDTDGKIFNSDGYLVNENHTVTNNKFKSLGISIQATPIITATYVYHVLEIQPNSPAEDCSLLPHSDYIIGATDGLFATGGEDLFARVINSMYNRNPNDCKIELIVYNHDFDIVRPVTICPRTNWGGNGILGCGVGYGYLHRLPQVVGKFEQSYVSNLEDRGSYLQAPGQTLFNLQIEGNNSSEFVAAGSSATGSLSNQMSLNDSSAPPISSSRRKKKYVHNTNTNDFSDYFKQETEKSEKLDVRIAASALGDLPPPPKKA